MPLSKNRVCFPLVQFFCRPILKCPVRQRLVLVGAAIAWTCPLVQWGRVARLLRIRGSAWLDNCKAEGRAACHLPLFPEPVPAATSSLLPGLTRLWFNQASSPQKHLEIKPDKFLGNWVKPCLSWPSILRTHHRGARGPFGLSHMITKGLRFTLLTPSSFEVNHRGTLRQLKEDIH